MLHDTTSVVAASRSDDADDAPIRVCMRDGLVVIQASGPADPDTTDALADALNAAVASGSVAVLDLDATVGASLVPPDVVASPDRFDPNAVAPVTTTEPGYLRLATASAWWTVDLRRRRLRCVDTAGSRRPDARGPWTSVCRLWVSATSVTALTAPGSFVSARR